MLCDLLFCSAALNREVYRINHNRVHSRVCIPDRGFHQVRHSSPRRNSTSLLSDDEHRSCGRNCLANAMAAAFIYQSENALKPTYRAATRGFSAVSKIGDRLLFAILQQREVFAFKANKPSLPISTLTHVTNIVST